MPVKSNLLYLALAVITGALIPVQAATNAAFSKSIGNPYLTGLMVFAIGLLGMIGFVLFTGTSLPAPRAWLQAPAYGYLGGLIVAVYVVMITLLVPRIGVSTAIALIVTGQIGCSILIDHFGLFRAAVRPVDGYRLAGVALMITGIYLIMRK